MPSRVAPARRHGEHIACSADIGGSCCSYSPPPGLNVLEPVVAAACTLTCCTWADPLHACLGHTPVATHEVATK